MFISQIYSSCFLCLTTVDWISILFHEHMKLNCLFCCVFIPTSHATEMHFCRLSSCSISCCMMFCLSMCLLLPPHDFLLILSSTFWSVIALSASTFIFSLTSLYFLLCIDSSTQHWQVEAMFFSFTKLLWSFYFPSNQDQLSTFSSWLQLQDWQVLLPYAVFHQINFFCHQENFSST